MGVYIQICSTIKINKVILNINNIWLLQITILYRLAYTNILVSHKK